MAISTAVAIYFLIWWVTLFAVLPWGVSSQGEEGAPGTDPGAPRVPHLVGKLIWTTLLATAVFAVIATIYATRLITIDDLAALMGFPR
jgi:predicted secreted protein